MGSPRGPRSLGNVLDVWDLRRRTTGRVLGSGALQRMRSPPGNVGRCRRIEGALACRQVVDYAVGDPVERITGLQQGRFEQARSVLGNAANRIGSAASGTGPAVHWIDRIGGVVISRLRGSAVCPKSR